MLTIVVDVNDGGGGWTLVLKARGDQNTWRYASTLWTTNTTLNENIVNDNFDSTECKYRSFNSVSYNRLRIRMQTYTSGGAFEDLNTMVITTSGSNLRSVVSSGSPGFTISPTSTDFVNLAGPRATLLTGCTSYGY